MIHLLGQRSSPDDWPILRQRHDLAHDRCSGARCRCGYPSVRLPSPVRFATQSMGPGCMFSLGTSGRLPPKNKLKMGSAGHFADRTTGLYLRI